MIVNLESGTLKLYKLNITNYYSLKKIMFDIALTGQKENRVTVGERINESNIFNITGKEKYIYTNLDASTTGRRQTKGGFYDESDYKEYINRFDIYKTPELYEILGNILMLNDQIESREVLAYNSLSKISSYCDLKKFGDKKLFEEYKKELLKIFYIERIHNKYIRDLNKLFQILYIDNKELSIFKQEEFMERYKVHTYDLKNIAKNKKNCC